MLIKRFCTLCMKSAVDISNQGSKRFYSASTKLTNTEVRKKRNAIFDEEKQRQREAFVKRVEKITVDYSGPPENVTLLMNKDISTPYNCAMHVHEYLMKRSVVALVNGQPWDMHRPLEENCSLEFKHMLEFSMGALRMMWISNYQTGNQLRFKSDQIPDIAAKSDHNRVIIYRMGDHIDITKGPLIANTSQFYRFQVTAMMYMLPDAFLKPKQEEIDDKEGDRLVSSTSSS
ncbi:RM39-like protein [Mya arenaria]|uniref:RM39-like protein n=1 Tax=Mya arenaria TaxID=6604 RepID=A0ABY7E6C4_MYAAR|nr:RM39-like protein [Mya arenaria]